jgi:hypothetical protein
MKILENIFPEKYESDIHAGEAYIIWTQIQAWYDVLELINIMINYINDTDLKLFFEHGVVKLIKNNINKLEELMKHFHIEFPSRPVKDVNTFRDEIIFRIIFDISQSSLLFHSKAINICSNDSLRNLFMNFLNEEMHAYDNLIKYGKVKKWVHTPPIYNKN